LRAWLVAEVVNELVVGTHGESGRRQKHSRPRASAPKG
jgi:hypothetical protein